MAENFNAPQGEEYGPDLITLEDENGKECTFEVIDAIDYKEVHYMAVIPYVEDPENLDEDAQLILMRVGQDEQGEYMDVVDDDEELFEVGGIFEERLKEFFDIDDDEIRH